MQGRPPKPELREVSPWDWVDEPCILHPASCIRRGGRSGGWNRYATSVTKLRTLSSAFDWRAAKIDWPVTTDVGPGLAGVVATETRVMWLDPSSGQLAYRGVPGDSLANRADFEDHTEDATPFPESATARDRQPFG